MRLVLLFLSCALVFKVFAQSQISSVKLAGLVKTDQDYLFQFIEIQPGDPFETSKIEQDRQRLINLEVIAHVNTQVTQTPDGMEVTFVCEELHTLLPIFSFGGIKENFWVQAGITEVNLRGRGNKFVGYYQYYDRSSFATHFTFDRIKQSPWGLNINLIKWATLEPLYFGSNQVEYRYTNYTAGITAIRHLNFTDRIELGGAFFTENYQRSTMGSFEGAPDEVNKNKLLGKTSIIWNRTNYHFFYIRGWQIQLNGQTVQSLDEDPAFYIFFHDFKRYLRIGNKGNFASRLRVGLSSNQETPFAPFVLDSYLNIRGVGNRVDRGTGAVILNVEHRHTFRDREKIAVQGVVFSDMGSWRNPGGSFTDFTESENLVLFAGGGLRLIHKKIFNAIFRIDYGFNLQNPEVNGFVLGIGQYF